MKKWLSVLLALLMLLTALPMGAVAAVSAETVTVPIGPYFAVSSAAGKAGDTVTVTVSAMNNPGIVSAKVRVGYDPTVLKLVEYAAGDFSAADYSWSYIDHNPFIINWCNALEPNSTEELLATLTFEIVGGASYGTTPLTLMVNCADDVFDYDLMTVSFDTLDGQVEVLCPVTDVVMDTTELALVEGDTATIHAEVLPTESSNKAKLWTSSDPSVVTVDSDGNVTAVGRGTATITVTTVDGGYTDTCVVTVACAHHYVAVPGYDADCVNTGLTDGVQCDKCGEWETQQEEIAPWGHSYNAVVTAPDCENDGYTTYTCSVCGDSYVADVVAALGHSYDAVVTAPDCENAGYTTYTCSVCGGGYVADYVDAWGHTEEIIPGKAATCTESGLTEGKKCSVCGEILVAQQTIPATGHTEVTDAAVAPTCTTTGLTEGKHCAVCGVMLIAQQVVPAPGHTYDAVVTDPTCLDGGYTTYTCACGDSYVANRVPAVGHIYDDVYDAECNVCGHIRDAQCKHSYDAVVTAPDCMNGGYTTYTCSKCGDSYVAEETAALGHTAVVVAGKEATCTETGLTEGYKCATCDVMLVAQMIIAAKGHTEMVMPGQASTCTETGLTEGKQCSVCGEVLVAQQVIPAKGHTAVVVAGKEATCTESGLTDGYKCSVCGEILVAQETIPALGHAYESVVTAPTCVAEGYTTYTCHCGDSYVANKVPATGKHTYDDATDTDCNVCGFVREVHIALPGDADGNDCVNNRDLGLLMRYINHWDVTIDVDACDVNDDGSINNKDLGMLQRYINEWDVTLK